MSETINIVAVIKECSLKADGDRLTFEDIKLDGGDPNRINRLVKAGTKVTISIQPLQESLPGTEGGEAVSSGKNGKAEKGDKRPPAKVKPGAVAANSRKNGKAAKPATDKPPANAT